MEPTLSDAEIDLASKMDLSVLRGDCALLHMLNSYYEYEINEAYETASKAIDQIVAAWNRVSLSMMEAIGRMAGGLY